MANLDEKTKNQIKVSGLSVTYFPGQNNEVKSLKNIDLSIDEGEFVIFFGPSGCGKSTLLYSLAGLEKFTGDAQVAGMKVSTMSVKDKEKYHRSIIGMVFQAYHLIPTLTVIQNVELPLVASGVKPAERKKRSMELLERFGVKTQAMKLPNQLSGGQQQRVAICRAVVNNPQILLADEPLGNLDSKSADEVIRLFKDINLKFGKTVILVTHDPTYLSIANKIFYLKDGQVVRVQKNEDTTMGVKEAALQAPAEIPRELDLLLKSFPSMAGKFGSMLVPFKAREIVSNVLTEMASDDIDSLSKRVEGLLINQGETEKSLFEFLDKNKEDGGLGLDRRRAEHLTEKIKNVLKEINIIVEKQKQLAATPDQTAQYCSALRECFLSYLELELPELDKERTNVVIDKIIQDRLDNKIARQQVEELFDRPLKDGGAGLDRRAAKRLAYRLELLMLGKY